MVLIFLPLSALSGERSEMGRRWDRTALTAMGQEKSRPGKAHLVFLAFEKRQLGLKTKSWPRFQL